MTLPEWCKLTESRCEIHNGTMIVYPKVDYDTDFGQELWNLSDYKVRTVSGQIVWMVRRAK